MQVFQKCLFAFEMCCSVQETDCSLMDLQSGSILYQVQSRQTSQAIEDTGAA